MRKIFKTCAAVCLTIAAFAQVAYASDAYYGKPKQTETATKLKAATKRFSNVVLVNNTYFNYTAYATFYGSGRPVNLPLGPVGSGRDVITYQIDYPDYQVCLNVVNAYGATVRYGCFNSGYVYVP